MSREKVLVVKRMAGDTRVKSFEELYELLEDHEEHDFLITLNFGIVSRRTLRLCKNMRFMVRFGFDGTRIFINKWELEVGVKDSTIPEAIRKGAFIIDKAGS